jgi:putative chitinase
MDIRKGIAAAAPKAVSGAASALEALEFTQDLEAAHFIGQLAHESGLVPLSENLSYSAKRLTQVFPSRFKTLASTHGIARNPEAMANSVYGGRMGNTQKGDGWKFRGRGFIQLTGRNNYTAAKKAIGIDIIKDPDLLLDPAVSAKVAHWFFSTNNIWRHTHRNDVNKVTRLINGGLHGIADRRKKTSGALAGLRGASAPLSTVRLGSRGKDARLLQAALNELGFGPLSVDGNFGPASVRGLKKFQRSLRLTVDGICGRNTWAIIARRQ